MAYRREMKTDIEHLQPPQSIDAEQMVIGSILKDPQALYKSIETLDTESHFYHPKHQIVFKAILDMTNRAEPCDIMTVANCLLVDGKLEKIGGRQYLVELVEGVGSTANLDSYLNIVLENSVLRRLIDSSNAIAQSAYQRDMHADALLDMAESTIFQISQGKLKQGFIPIKGIVDEVTKQIDYFQTTGIPAAAVKTGFDDLDSVITGLHNGDFIVVAGRPSMGKTSFALNIAEYASIEHNVGVGVFSIEMGKDQVVMRMLCGRAGISQQHAMSSKLNDREMRTLVLKGDALRNAPLYLDDSANLSILEMRAKARRLKNQHNIGLIIVDYIQMMHASGRYENRQQEITAISRGLKMLAKDLNLPVIACSQLSRMVEHRGGDKRPQLADLRESGAIEQDADLVLMVHRPEFYLSSDERKDPKNHEHIGVANIIISKNRNGRTGDVKLAFRGDLTRFVNLDARHRELPPDVEPAGDSPF
jgi:replicative DNA helicase